MRAGGLKKEACLRTKIDMATAFIVARDPVLYRINADHHPDRQQVGASIRMYDFTHCISDVLEGITRPVYLEFRDNRRLYDWYWTTSASRFTRVSTNSRV